MRLDRGPGAISTRVVATVLPSASADNMKVAISPLGGRICAVTVSVWPGGVNERTLTWVMRTGDSGVCAGQCGDSAATRSARSICASSSSVAGNTGRFGK